MIEEKRYKIILSVLLVLIIILGALYTALLSQKKSGKQEEGKIPAPTRSFIPQKIILERTIDPNRLPTLSPDAGGGVDIDSPLVASSAAEIQKLAQDLPYSQDYTLSSGVDVSVLIPGIENQSTSWTLGVDIFGINYNTSRGQEDYEIMRVSFREAVSNIFSWIRSKQADPTKIIFTWGDREYIRRTAEEWLKE